MGTVVGREIDDELFRMIMGAIIFLSLGVMIWMEKGMRDFVPDYWWFAGIMGILCGFTTMVGNLAGSAAAFLDQSQPQAGRSHFVPEPTGDQDVGDGREGFRPSQENQRRSRRAAPYHGSLSRYREAAWALA